jgi:sugar phosphate isomerase/epimerase
MKFGISTLVGIEPLPLPELARRASELGLESLEINVGPTFQPIGDAAYPGHLDLAAVTQGGAGAVLDTVGRYGLTISALAPMINLLAPDPQVRAERSAVFRQALDACQALGVDTIVTYAGSASGMYFWGPPAVGPHHPLNKLDENLQLFKEVYTPLADYAGERGVRIAFETAARGGGQGNLAHAPALWDMLFDAAPSPALGLSFDPSHLVWLHVPNIPDVVRRYGARIFHVDGKDTEILRGKLAEQGILGNGWWRYRLPGCGDLDWRPILSALRDVGYTGALDIENEDPLCLGLAGAAWSANYLRRLLPEAR